MRAKTTHCSRTTRTIAHFRGPHCISGTTCPTDCNEGPIACDTRICSLLLSSVVSYFLELYLMYLYIYTVFIFFLIEGLRFLINKYFYLYLSSLF